MTHRQIQPALATPTPNCRRRRVPGSSLSHSLPHEESIGRYNYDQYRPRDDREGKKNFASFSFGNNCEKSRNCTLVLFFFEAPNITVLVDLFPVSQNSFFRVELLENPFYLLTHSFAEI